MGFKDTQWATKLDLPMKWKVVLLAVCIATNDEDHVTIAGQGTLAKSIGASVDKVRDALGVLEAMGAITRARRSGSGGYRTSDQITVNRAYTVDTPLGDSPTREISYEEESGYLTGNLPEPTPEISGAEEINQIDQPEDQPEISPMTLDDEFEAWIASPLDPNELQFGTFWAIWPKKVSKLDATKAWCRAIKKAPPMVIYDAAKAYADSPYLPPRQFIPNAASWLNGERWNDPPLQPDEIRRNPTRNDHDLAYLTELARREQQTPKEISA